MKTPQLIIFGLFSGLKHLIFSVNKHPHYPQRLSASPTLLGLLPTSLPSCPVKSRLSHIYNHLICWHRRQLSMWAYYYNGYFHFLFLLFPLYISYILRRVSFLSWYILNYCIYLRVIFFNIFLISFGRYIQFHLINSIISHIINYIFLYFRIFYVDNITSVFIYGFHIQTFFLIIICY